VLIRVTIKVTIRVVIKVTIRVLIRVTTRIIILTLQLRQRLQSKSKRKKANTKLVL